MRLDTLFGAIGGEAGCRRLSERFHELAAEDDRLRAIFPENMSRLADHFTLFLGDQTGGHKSYAARRGKQSLVCRHAHLSISTKEANRWLSCMAHAMEDVGIQEPYRQRLQEYFTETALTLTDPFLPFYGLPLDDLRARVRQDPELLRETGNGHSILMEAVGRCDVERVRALLELGANPNAKQPFQHGPLYRASNVSNFEREADGRIVVELLIAHGAKVDWPSGPGRCTPLHMAARRGNVSIADALLVAGASIEQRDAKGETPLRRAVNCGNERMASFLVTRGADILNRDRQGLSVTDAAKDVRMRRALQG